MYVCICGIDLSLFFCSQELEEQEVELSDMYEQRMKLLQKSVKKAASRKRRRQDDSKLRGYVRIHTVHVDSRAVGNQTFSHHYNL